MHNNNVQHKIGRFRKGNAMPQKLGTYLESKINTVKAKYLEMDYCCRYVLYSPLFWYLQPVKNHSNFTKLQINSAGRMCIRSTIDTQTQVFLAAGKIHFMYSLKQIKPFEHHLKSKCAEITFRACLLWQRLLQTQLFQWHHRWPFASLGWVLGKRRR